MFVFYLLMSYLLMPPNKDPKLSLHNPNFQMSLLLLLHCYHWGSLSQLFNLEYSIFVFFNLKWLIYISSNLPQINSRLAPKNKIFRRKRFIWWPIFWFCYFYCLPPRPTIKKMAYFNIKARLWIISYFKTINLCCVRCILKTDLYIFF